MAINLLARLYPRISIEGPAELQEQLAAIATSINPACELVDSASDTLGIHLGPALNSDHNLIQAWARGWNALVGVDEESLGDSAAVPAALATAACAVGELFRQVFRTELAARGKNVSPSCGGFNLITLGEPSAEPLVPSDTVDVGRIHLAGAGAIGQAAALTLARMDARGTLIAVDHETLTLSNLQRYLGAEDADVDEAKVLLLKRRFATKTLKIQPVYRRWEAHPFDNEAPETVLVALDSAEDRIGVQASLPRRVYNAFTQPEDLGWSRHESFGNEPCLACMYWPTRRRPSQYELVAQSVGQHELRALAYLVSKVPVGTPLPPGGIPEQIPHLPPPAEAERWLTTAILDDIAAANNVPSGVLAAWRQRSLDEFYREGICGGALLDAQVGGGQREVVVPLAHQSALAGIMLATQLIAAESSILVEHRSVTVEGRLDVLTPLPQILAVPRAREPLCLCGDADFQSAHGERWQSGGSNSK